jgi:ribonuclease R
MIHRIIKEFINGKIDEERIKRLTNIVDYAAKQSSDMERLAQEAEREVDDLKKAEFMLDKVGQEFEGMISSVTSFGFFVVLPNTVEGLVHISDLKDDYYNYDERHLCLLGENTKNIYRLGDSIKIIVESVDIDAREIYFGIAKDESEDEEETYEPALVKRVKRKTQSYPIITIEELEKQFDFMKPEKEDEAD